MPPRARHRLPPRRPRDSIALPARFFCALNGDFATREAGAGSTRIVAFTDYDVKSDLATVASGDHLTSNGAYTGVFVRSVDLAA